MTSDYDRLLTKTKKNSCGEQEFFKSIPNFGGSTAIGNERLLVAELLLAKFDECFTKVTNFSVITYRYPTGKAAEVIYRNSG